ncbi:MAG: leucyl aminopeptidase [Blastocatellia bacterium]|nr:leucyl aminopeptidase [Blastocatellia bacterium]
MKITASRRSFEDVNEDVFIVPVFEGETPDEGALARLNHITDGAVASVFDSGEFNGKRDRWVLLYKTGALRAQRLMLYGAGRFDDANPFGLQRLAGTAVRMLRSRAISSAAFLLRDRLEPETSARAIIEGWALGQEDTDLYKSQTEDTRPIESLDLVSDAPDAPDLSRAVSVGIAMAEATNFARRLGNEPGNMMTPIELARQAEAMAAREGLAFEAFDEEELKSMGCGALLAVSRGSDEPARMIVLSHEPEKEDFFPQGEASQELIALVGKGITFDSGGISIKPAAKMDEMKFDMGGGAAVIGAMQAIARIKPGVRVLGVVPAAENLPSGKAVKPGDVVRSLSGKTIEVLNTDAEGRLALADALAYAVGRGATHMVDAATLTGACAIALGAVRAAVMGTDQRIIDGLIQAGELSGERLWQMPFDSKYADFIKSDIADVKNVGNRKAGTVTAGMFLKTFTNGLPWAHLDIAGTAWLEEEKPYMSKGATGFGTRAMAGFVIDRAARR